MVRLRILGERDREVVMRATDWILCSIICLMTARLVRWQGSFDVFGLMTAGFRLLIFIVPTML